MSVCVLEPQRSSLFALAVPDQPLSNLERCLAATVFVGDTDLCSFVIGEQWQVDGAGECTLGEFPGRAQIDARNFVGE